MMPKFEELINQGLPARIRSNHALEHATLHVLGEQGFKGRLSGISDAGGFYIYGDVPTEALLLAAKEALKRLQGGEAGLAVHPNCGTNLVVGSLAAGGLAWVSMLGTKGKFSRRLRRMPVAVLAGLIGYQMAKPLGPKLQETITTSADVGGLAVVEVVQHELLGGTVHRVKTRYSPQ
jgi:hypothetical protein